MDRKKSANNFIQILEPAVDVFVIAYLRQNFSWKGKICFNNDVDDEAGAWVKHYGFQIDGPSAEEVRAWFVPEVIVVATAEVAKPKSQEQLDR